MSSVAEIFKKVSGIDSNRLLGLLHIRRGTVLFKFPDSGVYRVKAASKGWGQSIMSVRPPTLTDSRRDQVVTGNFLLDGQMYFFNAKVRLQKKQMHLQLTGDLQRLARRKLERFPVPETVALHFVSKRIGDKLMFLRGPVMDLSVKGCRVALITARPEIKVGAGLTALLRYDSRKPITVHGNVRHQRRPSKGRYDQIFGVEFSKCDDLIRLQGWLVDLQRELFAQKKNRKK